MGNDYFRRAHTIEIKEAIAAARYLQIKPHTILSYDIKNKKFDFDEENMDKKHIISLMAFLFLVGYGSKLYADENDWNNYLRETYFYSTEIVQETVEIKTELNLKV